MALNRPVRWLPALAVASEHRLTQHMALPIFGCPACTKWSARLRERWQKYDPALPTA